MDSDVETHKLHKGLVITETEEGRKVMGVILVGVNGRELALAVKVVEDAACNVGQLGNANKQSQHMCSKKIEDVRCTHRSMLSSKVGPQ